MIKKILVGVCGLLILAVLAGIVLGGFPHAGGSRVAPLVEIYPTPIAYDISNAPVTTPQVRVDGINEFVLSDSVRLPMSPAHVPIYTWADAAAPSLEQLRAVARQFGFMGPLYTAPKGSPQQGYVALAGLRTLVFSDTFLTYSDRSVAIYPRGLTVEPLPYARAQQIASDFLASHGVSTTGYRAERVLNQYGLTGVRFAPVIGGRPVKVFGRFGLQVDISADGRVQDAFDTPYTFNTVAAGDAEIVSVQEAMQRAQAHNLLNMMVNPLMDFNPHPNDVLSWQPQYRPGETADLWDASFMVLAPLDPAGQPYMEVSANSLRLQGNLEELAVQSEHPLRIWGAIRQQDDALILDVAGWSLVPPAASYLGISGTLTASDTPGHYLLHGTDRRTYLLLHVPDDVPQGREVIVNATETDQVEDGHTVLYWTTLQFTRTFEPATPATVPPVQPTRTGRATATAHALMSSTDINASPVPPFADGERLEGVEGRLSVVVEQNVSGDQVGIRADLNEEPLDHAGWAARLDIAGLEDLPQQDGLRVRVWGRYDAPARLIRVERYERANPGERIQVWFGKLVTATVQGRTIELFETATGERLAPANTLRYGELPPAQVLSYHIIKEGVLRADTFGGYPIIETLTDHYYASPTAPDLDAYKLTPRPRVERVFHMGKGLIEHVELGYLVQGRTSEMAHTTPEAAALLTRPIWCFTGYTESGSAFELWIDALTTEAARRYGFPAR